MGIKDNDVKYSKYRIIKGIKNKNNIYVLYLTIVSMKPPLQITPIIIPYIKIIVSSPSII